MKQITLYFPNGDVEILNEGALNNKFNSHSNVDSISVNLNYSPDNVFIMFKDRSTVNIIGLPYILKEAPDKK